MIRKYHLRALKPKDAERMLEWMHDDEIMCYFRFDGKNKTIEDVRKFIKLSSDETVNIQRAIVTEDDLYCGTVSLKNIDDEDAAEFAIVVHPDAIGTGAGSQAIRDILEEAFCLKGLKRVYLNVIQDNERAIHVYEKQGFRYKNKSQIKVCDKDLWLKWYEITKEEYYKEV